MTRPFKPTIAAAALLFACLAYVPGLNGPFVHDDFTNLAVVLVPIDSWHQALDAILSNGSGLLRRPVANASLLANQILLGDDPIAFKLISLLLHAACGVTIYAIGRTALRACAKCTDAPHVPFSHGLALAIAMIWLAHPLGVSTVLYVVQRMTILSALFSLCAFWWLMYGFAGGRSWLSIAGFYLSTLLAVASKESGALTPAYATALVLLVGHGHLREFISLHRKMLTFTILLPAVAGVIILFGGLDHIMSGYERRPFTLPQRLASQSVILWQYIGNIFIPLPSGMHFFRDDAPIRNPDDAWVLLSVTGWLLTAAWATHRYRSNPWPAFALVWYLGGHAMESSIIALDLAYEHRNYLPMLGPMAAAVAAVQRLLTTKTHLPLRTVTLLVVACLMVATGARAFTWSSLPRLIAHELAAAPKSLRAQYYGYFIALTRNDWPNADYHLAVMRKLDPNPGWIDTSVLLSRCHGHPGAQADEHIQASIVANAADERTQRGLQQIVGLSSAGTCRLPFGLDLRQFLAALGQYTEQTGAARSAADYYYMVSSMDWSTGNLESSARLLEKSASLAPNNSRPAEQLIVVQLALGNTAKARTALEQANHVWAKREPWKRYRYERWLTEIEQVEREISLD